MRFYSIFIQVPFNFTHSLWGYLTKAITRLPHCQWSPAGYKSISNMNVSLCHGRHSELKGTKHSKTMYSFYGMGYTPMGPHRNGSHKSDMMTSSNENIFRVTGPLCGEFTGHRWIPLTKASDAELWCFLWSAPWIIGWVNSRGAGELTRHCANYDVIVLQRLHLIS